MVKLDTRIIIGFLVLLFVIVLAYSTFSNYLVQYRSVSDVVQEGPAGMIWVNGAMQKNSLTSSDIGEYTFGITDGTSTINVSFNGELPSSLGTESDIVIFGTYRDSVFYAEKLTSKCPTKYQG